MDIFAMDAVYNKRIDIVNEVDDIARVGLYAAP